MKTVTICSHDIKKVFQQSFIEKFSFCDVDIPVGVLPIENYDFNLNNESDVLIEVKSFSCNYRDRALMLAFYDKCRNSIGQDNHMYSPFGSDFMAVVKKVVSNVKKLKVGDRVIPNCHYYDPSSICHGVPTNYASQRIHIFHEDKLIKVQDIMSDEVVASFSINSQTAYSMIRKAEVKNGEKVLVTAPTSNTSLSIIKALKNKGCTIFATSINRKSEDSLWNWGVDQFIPAESLLHDGRNNILFDVVFDPFYDLYLHGVINHINYNGRYIFCGLCEQYMRIDKSNMLFKEDYKRIFQSCLFKNISIIGNCIGLRSDLEDALQDYSDKKYDILIDSVYSDTDVIPFLERSFKNSFRTGKVVYRYID
jgi:NADPH:quinone reductase-like Zn-dependent oxidoreductase